MEGKMAELKIRNIAFYIHQKMPRTTGSFTKIYIARSKIKKAGRGVFAARSIKQGDIIEKCPVLVFPRKDYLLVKKTELRNYYFMWGKSTSAVCFGYGSIYNHSYEPNATYEKRIREKTIKFIAIKNIKEGEEITVNYNYGKPKDQSPLWIKSIKVSKNKHSH